MRYPEQAAPQRGRLYPETAFAPQSAVPLFRLLSLSLHSHADVGRRDCRGVVDPVARHRARIMMGLPDYALLLP